MVGRIVGARSAKQSVIDFWRVNHVMKKRKKTLRRSILIGTTLFILLLCIVMGLVHYHSYRQVLYSRYESTIREVIQFVAAEIDADDLAECIRTGKESEKYHKLQTVLDQVKERALVFADELRCALAKRARELHSLRVRIVGFRDCYADLGDPACPPFVESAPMVTP